MAVQNDNSFDDCVVVACGTLSIELNHLKRLGVLDARRILYTRPGRHEAPKELESRLVRKIAVARRFSNVILVVYGGKFCHIDASNPGRGIDDILAEQGPGIARVDASHCVDMLADAEQREQISGGVRTFWLTPGWIVYRSFVFQDWDIGLANETFPQCTGGAALLDAVGFWDRYCETHPEHVLEFSDWMGIPIQPQVVSLDRLTGLLSACASKAREAAA
jgi:hypothetical protein